MARAALVCLALLLAAACSEDADPLRAPEAPAYWANTSPDSVAANVALAWAARDAAGYAGLLDAGFEFYFYADDPSYTFFWNRTREAGCAERLLSGEIGDVQGGLRMPPVVSVTMALTPTGEWEGVTPADLDGHSVPAGTLGRDFDLAMRVRLGAPIEGTAVVRLDIDAGTRLYCAPQGAGDPEAWRLWRWEDHTGSIGRAVPAAPTAPAAGAQPGTEDFTLSSLKLFFDPETEGAR